MARSVCRGSCLLVALDVMLSGKDVSAQRAHEIGLVDAVGPGLVRETGRRARALAASGVPLRRLRERRVDVSTLEPEYFDAASADVRASRPAGLAAQAIVRSVQAAATLSPVQGEVVEAQLFDACRVSPQAKAMCHVFFAERAASCIPELSDDLLLLPVERIGILGAGTMGRGIAMVFVGAGIPTLLVAEPSKHRTTQPQTVDRCTGAQLRVGDLALSIVRRPAAGCRDAARPRGPSQPPYAISVAIAAPITSSSTAPNACWRVWPLRSISTRLGAPCMRYGLRLPARDAPAHP